MKILIAAVTALAVLTGCGGDSVRDSMESAPAGDQQFGSTTAPEQPDAAEPGGEPDGEEPYTPPPPAAPSRADLPPLFTPEQGDPYWAAVVAYSEDKPDDPTDGDRDPAVRNALKAVRDAGYDVEGVTDAGCLPGVESIVDMGDDFNQVYVVELAFKTEDEARQFERNFGRDIVGVTQVNGSCLD